MDILRNAEETAMGGMVETQLGGQAHGSSASRTLGLKNGTALC